MQSSSQATSEQQWHAPSHHQHHPTGGIPVVVPQPHQSHPSLFSSTGSQYATVPPGWATVMDPNDGRIYYLETSTGRRSWVHPHASSMNTDLAGNTPTSTMNYLRSMFPRQHAPTKYDDTLLNHHNPLDTPLNATRRPDTNQCYAVVSCILFPPIGILAVYHSCMTDKCWKEGRYSDAIGHARESPKYSGLAVCLGIAFWIWYIFFRRDGGADWFDGLFDFNFD
ncbi:expressed unknown protein [Seminavis robusta]|uniref:WW domain-containing protein n=1 Tax=Seminavis robusta TaxID=568900 RepID=A0A9N8D7Z1_9STRA|nr:expressed unknown protein [Seminavis robusta]|eukprot:Sro31_g020190.1 n/a (224) ;mRNA; f:60362-61033